MPLGHGERFGARLGDHVVEVAVLRTSDERHPLGLVVLDGVLRVVRLEQDEAAVGEAAHHDLVGDLHLDRGGEALEHAGLDGCEEFAHRGLRDVEDGPLGLGTLRAAHGDAVFAAARLELDGLAAVGAAPLALAPRAHHDVVGLLLGHVAPFDG